MQAFKEQQLKPFRYRNCPKSFKSSNGFKYHLDKVHSSEANRMEMANTGEMEGKLGIIFMQFPSHTNKPALLNKSKFRCVF